MFFSELCCIAVKAKHVPRQRLQILEHIVANRADGIAAVAVVAIALLDLQQCLVACCSNVAQTTQTVFLYVKWHTSCTSLREIYIMKRN